jgi:hypothetical protein
MVKEWLTEKTTIEDTEADIFRYSGPEQQAPGDPWYDDWQEFKAQLKPGDELWNWSSPPESWRMMGGRAGVAIVRNGEIVAVHLIHMN